MKTFSRILAVPVALLMLTGASCSTLTNRLETAKKTEGTTRARVNIPKMPADCDVKEPHADVTIGAEALSILKRERAALNRQNARTGRCVEFHDNLARKLR